MIYRRLGCKSRGPRQPLFSCLLSFTVMMQSLLCRHSSFVAIWIFFPFFPEHPISHSNPLNCQALENTDLPDPPLPSSLFSDPLLSTFPSNDLSTQICHKEWLLSSWTVSLVKSSLVASPSLTSTVRGSSINILTALTRNFNPSLNGKTTTGQ